MCRYLHTIRKGLFCIPSQEQCPVKICITKVTIYTYITCVTSDVCSTYVDRLYDLGLTLVQCSLTSRHSVSRLFLESLLLK